MKLANGITFLTVLAVLTAGAAIAQTEHFHPKGKPPSEHTLKVLEAARKTLPFSDTRDFDEEKKGFIAAPESWTIMANAGNVAWDMERYKFLYCRGTVRVVMDSGSFHRGDCVAVEQGGVSANLRRVSSEFCFNNILFIFSSS